MTSCKLASFSRMTLLHGVSECGNYFSLLLWHEHQCTFSVNLVFGDLTLKTFAFPSKITDRYIKTAIPSWTLTASIHSNHDYSMSVQVHRETSCIRHLHPMKEQRPTDNVSTHCPFPSVLKLEAPTVENLKQRCSVPSKCCPVRNTNEQILLVKDTLLCCNVKQLFSETLLCH